MDETCVGRAYKLGRGRWSYNKCVLYFQQEGTETAGASDEPLTVAQAVVVPTTSPDCDAQVSTSQLLSYMVADLSHLRLGLVRSVAVMP